MGRINFEEDGDYIDCTKMGVGGKAIPSLVNKIKNIKGDAKFILLVCVCALLFIVVVIVVVVVLLLLRVASS